MTLINARNYNDIICTYERSEGLQSHIYLPLEYEKKKKGIWNLRKRYAVFYKIKKRLLGKSLTTSQM